MDYLQLLPEQLQQASASNREIVLRLKDALDAIDILRSKGIEEIAWEGWILYPDGNLGHSAKYRGTVGFFPIDECVQTMKEDYESWLASPEIDNGILLFCLTPATRNST